MADDHAAHGSNTASQEDMKKAMLPLAWRDNCSGLLIPLNRCRHREFYLPWKCEDERHGYERCLFADYMRRVAVYDEIRRREKEGDGSLAEFVDTSKHV